MALDRTWPQIVKQVWAQLAKTESLNEIGIQFVPIAQGGKLTMDELIKGMTLALIFWFQSI